MMATTLSRELSGEEAFNNKTPNDESAFQNWIRNTDWFKEFKAEFNEEPDLDTKDYDYRAAWKAGISPERDPYDQNRFHWPSSLPTGEMLKSADHPTAWKEYFMRDTGVNPDALGLKTPEDANIYLKKNGGQKVPNSKGSAMSTALDLNFNPLGSLGIGKNSSAPTDKSFGEDEVATAKALSFSGREQLARSYTEERRLIEKQGSLEEKIAKDTANLVAYRSEQELFKARQQEKAAKADSENITKMIDEIRKSPLYKQKEEINKQIAEYSAFVPTEVTAPMLGVLFAAIGATGMLLGGNSKNNAKAALSAMNGMAEGFGKGREQYDKERKQAFDTNVKLLQTKLSAINDGLEDARREAILNKEAADIKVRQTLAANDAQFLQENTNKRGLESTIELVKGQLKNLEKALGLQTTKTRQIEGQLNRDAQALENRKIAAAHSETLQRIAAESRATEAAARREFQLEMLSKKQGALGQPIAIKGNQAFFVDGNGKIVTVTLPEGAVPVGKLQPRPEPRTPAPRTGKGEGKGQPSSGAGGAVQFRYNSAMVNAGNQLAIEVANAADLPALAAPPAFAEVLTDPSKGLTEAGKRFFTQKITEPESRAMQQVFAGMQRAMTTIESSGRPSGATEAAIKEFGKTLPRAGDNKINTYLFLAQARQVMEILEKDLKAAGATDEQIKQAVSARKEVEDIITWTVKDVNRILSKDGARLVDDRTRNLMQNSQTLREFNSELKRKSSGGESSSIQRGDGIPETRLAERMDQLGATPGGSDADERSQAQLAIAKIHNSKLDREEKQKRVKNIESFYKQRTGLDL
jgi:hypothetical protein